MAYRVEAVLFDLDGTLFDFSLARSVNKQFGGQKYIEAINELKSRWNSEEKSRRKAFAKYVKKVNQSFRGTKVEVIEDFVHENFRRCMFNDVEDTLQDLKNRVKVGILTTQFQFYANVIGRELGIEDVTCSEAELKDGVITGKLNHFIDKREGVKRYAEKMRINTRNIAYVGDDIDPLGVVICIFVGSREEYRNKADYVINKISELPDLIRRLI